MPRSVDYDKKPEILDKNPRHGSCDTLFNPKRPPFRPKEEGADHVRLEFPLAGVARKTLHLKVAGMSNEVWSLFEHSHVLVLGTWFYRVLGYPVDIPESI